MYKNLVHIVMENSREFPDKKAYSYLENGEVETESISYQELDQAAKGIGQQLQGLKSFGERVILIYPPGLDYIKAFLGVLYAGAIAVPVVPPMPNQSLSKLQAILIDSQASFILTTGAMYQLWPTNLRDSPLMKNIKVLITDRIESVNDFKAIFPIDSEKTAFLQYTSGSTGSPKGVMVSHRNLIENLEYIKRRFELSRESVSVTWLPNFHDMGLIDGVLQPLYSGFLGVIMPPIAFLQKPIRWLTVISEYKGTHSGGPNFGYELCLQKVNSAECNHLDLSNWVTAYNGAEPIRAATLDRFVAQYRQYGFKPEYFFPCYGLAESTLMVSGGPVDKEYVTLDVDLSALGEGKIVLAPNNKSNSLPLVSSGQIGTNMNVAIVDPDKQVVIRTGQVGEIWVSGPSVAIGYWKNVQGTEDTFNAYFEEDGDQVGPFMRTGDLGFIRSGELFVTGRLKDLIIIRGQNHYPQDIEFTVEKVDSVLRPGCNASFSIDHQEEERLIVIQEVRESESDWAPILSKIRKSIILAHQLDVYTIVLVPARTVPKTSSGKIQRQATKKLFLQEKLKPVAIFVNEGRNNLHLVTKQSGEDIRMSDDFSPQKIENWIALWLANQIGISVFDLNLKTSFSEYGLDSVRAVQLAQGLSDWLPVKEKLDPTILWEYTTISRLTEHLGKLLKGENMLAMNGVAGGKQRDSFANMSEDELANLLREELE